MNAIEFLAERKRQMREHERTIKRLTREHEQRMQTLNEEACERQREFCEAQDRAMLRIVDAGLEDDEKQAIRAAVEERERQMKEALANVESIGRHYQRLNRWSTWFCWSMFWLSGFLFRGVIHGW